MVGEMLAIHRFTIRGGQMLKLLICSATSTKNGAAVAVDDDQSNLFLTIENCNSLYLESDRYNA